MEFCLARKKFIVFLTFSLVLQLFKVNGYLGKTQNKMLSNLPTVRKRFMSHDFESFRNGPPIGSYIYIMGHLSPDELEEHGLSVNRRSPPKTSQVDKKPPPVSIVQPPVTSPDSQQEVEALRLTRTRERLHNMRNDRRLERTEDIIRKWMKHRMKRMDSGAAKDFGADLFKQQADRAKESSTKENFQKDLKMHLPKMHFMKWLHFPYLEKSFPDKLDVKDEWKAQTFDREINPSASGEMRSYPRSDDLSMYVGENEDGKNGFLKPTPSDPDETYKDALNSKYVDDPSERRNY